MLSVFPVRCQEREQVGRDLQSNDAGLTTLCLENEKVAQGHVCRSIEAALEKRICERKGPPLD